MAQSQRFYFRDAGVDDVQFIADTDDSTIPFLVQSGSAGQWGTEPLSQTPGFIEAKTADLRQSVRFRTTGEGERLRIMIAEVEDGDSKDVNDKLSRRTDDQGKTYLAVGSLRLCDEYFSKHLLETEGLQSRLKQAQEDGKFVLLDLLVADFRTGEKRRGVGAAMVEKTKQYAIENGKKTIWLDCWLGGSGKLAQYYEKLGFQPVQDFKHKEDDGSLWPARLFRMDVI